jgi:hypothetical protein
MGSEILNKSPKSTEIDKGMALAGTESILVLTFIETQGKYPNKEEMEQIETRARNMELMRLHLGHQNRVPDQVLQKFLGL